MNQANLERFMELYHAALEQAVVDHPEEYPWHPSLPVPVVVARMRAAMVENTFSHVGHAMKSTCKALGIPYTRRAILEFLR